MEFFAYTRLVEDKDPLELRDKYLKYGGKRVIFDLDNIVCEDQITMALRRAERAALQGRMIANTWGIEVLIHLAANHQISEALDLLAISPQTNRIGIIQDQESADERLQAGLSIADPNPDLLELYGLTSKEPCLELIQKGVSVIVNHE